MYGVYKGVSAVITNAKVDDCLERAILTRPAHGGYRLTDEAKRYALNEMSRGLKLQMWPECSPNK
jgi:hypothetical protein